MISIKYHAIFDYELIKSDFPKWLHKKDKSITGIRSIKSKKRLQREKISRQKLQIAQKAAKILSKIPTVKFVGVTGSLAMMNSNENSDIDLMIVTSSNNLWTTRLFTYLLIHLFGFKRRFPMEKAENDKLCFNLWLDEDDLVWRKSDRNIYTSHEIAQIMPLVNKDKTYEKFLFQNKWILSFWPYAVRILNLESRIWNKNSKFQIPNSKFSPVEKLAFKLQYLYMKIIR